MSDEAFLTNDLEAKKLETINWYFIIIAPVPDPLPDGHMVLGGLHFKSRALTKLSA